MDNDAEQHMRSQTHWPLILGEANGDMKTGCKIVQGHGTQTMKDKCTIN